MNHRAIMTALEPNLLSSPFRIETKWYVLTGAACTGKTTLIELLAGKGYPTMPESARLYFESEMAKGRTLEEIRADGASLQRGIAASQMHLEDGHPASKTIFLDRAIPDSLTFFRVFGLDPNEILPQCFTRRYAGVFILEQLPFQRAETLGPEDDATSDFLDEWLVRDYTALGYRVVRVPVLPPQKRLAFVLERLSEQSYAA